MSSVLRRAFKNLILLGFVALPLGVLALELQTVLFPPRWMVIDGAHAEFFSAALFEFVVFLPSVLLGGLIHQGLLWAVLRRLSGWALRLAILLSSVVIAVVLLLIEWTALSGTWRAVVPIAIIVLAYGIAARPLVPAEE